MSWQHIFHFHAYHCRYRLGRLAYLSQFRTCFQVLMVEPVFLVSSEKTLSGYSTFSFTSWMASLYNSKLHTTIHWTVVFSWYKSFLYCLSVTFSMNLFWWSVYFVMVNPTGVSTVHRCRRTLYLSWRALPCLSAAAYNFSWCWWFNFSINSWCADWTLFGWA